jgi:hypothetical protein
MTRPLETVLLLAAACAGCGEGDRAADGPKETHSDASAHDAQAPVGLLADAEIHDAAATEDAGAQTCDLLQCDAVETDIARFAACCTPARACGLRPADAVTIATFEASLAPEYNEPGACLPLDKLTTKSPTLDEQRVPNPGGVDIYITTECETSGILSLPFKGCCLPSGRCGVSSYPVYSTLAVVLEGMSAGFTQLECVSSDEMNRQLQATVLAGFGAIPSTDGPCDYEGLVERLQAP